MPRKDPPLQSERRREKFKDMQLVTVPRGLRRAVEALALCLPLAALQVILAKHSPWWRLPYRQMGFACAPVALACLIVAVLILKGKKVGFYATIACSALWLLSSAWMTFRFNNTTLGVFTLCLGGLLLSYLAWLRLELGRSFLDPYIHWYEGLPRPVPGLECQVLTEGARAEYRVARLDREGVFVFRDNSKLEQKRAKYDKAQNQELLISFRDRHVRCVGIPIRVMDRMGTECGIGFQFQDMSSDAQKTLGDFVEALKGEGYVS